MYFKHICYFIEYEYYKGDITNKGAKKDSSFIARMERYLVSGGAALPLHGKSVSVKACHQDIKRVRCSMWKNNNMIEKSHHAESCFSTNILVGLLPSNS